MKDIHITVPDDVYQALNRAASENALKTEDLLRVQIEKFVRTYNDETSPEVREHIRATIEEYRDVLERLAT